MLERQVRKDCEASESSIGPNRINNEGDRQNKQINTEGNGKCRIITTSTWYKNSAQAK